MGTVVRQCSKAEVAKYFESSGVDISDYTDFFIGNEKRDFVIASCVERTSGIYLNEPDILTEAQEGEVYTMTGVHVNTLCSSDVVGMHEARAKVTTMKTILIVSGVITLILTAQVGVALIDK